MTTNQALQKLYKKIVGSDSKKNSVAKNIQALAENWPSLEVLPAHAAEDSGKVLAVKSDGTLEWKTLG